MYWIASLDWELQPCPPNPLTARVSNGGLYVSTASPPILRCFSPSRVIRNYAGHSEGTGIIPRCSDISFYFHWAAWWLEVADGGFSFGNLGWIYCTWKSLKIIDFRNYETASLGRSIHFTRYIGLVKKKCCYSNDVFCLSAEDGPVSYDSNHLCRNR